MSLASPLGSTYGARLSAYLTTYEDFRKHRKRTNKSLLKLRHDLNLVTRDTRNYKEKEKTSAISKEDYAADARYGSLLLLLAERDSLFANEIKSLLEISGEKLSSYKKLMVSKLKKAVSTSTKLLSITEGEVDVVKRIELYVYAALTYGVYSVNKKRWDEAVYAFSVARCGLELLAAQIPDSASDGLYDKTLIDELVDTIVDPSLNLAVSQGSAVETTSDLRTVSRKHCNDATIAQLAPAVALIASVDQTFVQEIEEEEVAKTVVWRDHEANIYNDELSIKIIKLTRANWKSFSDANDYDSLYSQWSALVDVHSGDLAKNTDEDDEQKVQDGAILLTYLKYNMLFTRLKRDLLLIHQLTTDAVSSVSKRLHSNKDVLRLYSAVISAVDELKDLPGVYNDEDLFESLENMGRFFTVKRSVTIADSYSLARKFPEALKIYAQIERTFDASETFYKVDEFPYDVTSNAQVEALTEEVSRRKVKAQSLAQFAREDSGNAANVAVDDVFRFSIEGNTTQNVTSVLQKGQIAPVLSKAVLFDIAFNYISYTSQPGQAAQAEVDDGEEKKKGGFFGIFGR